MLVQLYHIRNWVDNVFFEEDALSATRMGAIGLREDNDCDVSAFSSLVEEGHDGYTDLVLSARC